MTKMVMFMTMMFHLKDLNGDPSLQCHQQLWQSPILKIEFLRAGLLSIRLQFSDDRTHIPARLKEHSTWFSFEKGSSVVVGNFGGASEPSASWNSCGSGFDQNSQSCWQWSGLWWQWSSWSSPIWPPAPLLLRPAGGVLCLCPHPPYHYDHQKYDHHNSVLTHASSTKLPRQSGAIENNHQSILKSLEQPETWIISFATFGDTGM